MTFFRDWSVPAIVAGFVTVLVGFTGWFERATSRIPLALAAAMLAGVLLRFGLDVFVAMKTQFGMVFAMFCVYLVARRWLPRYAVPAALALGLAIAAVLGLLDFSSVRFALAQPVFTAPTFSVAAMIGVALPLFVVTMASQNVPGVAVMRSG